MSATRTVLSEAIAEKPQQGSVKDWMCTWLDSTLTMVASMCHVLPGFFVGSDPAHPKGVLRGEIRSRGNMYKVTASLYAMASKRDSVELQMKIGSAKTEYLSFKQAFPASSFPSAIAATAAEFLRTAKPQLDAVASAEEGSMKKNTLGRKKMLT